MKTPINWQPNAAGVEFTRDVFTRAATTGNPIHAHIGGPAHLVTICGMARAMAADFTVTWELSDPAQTWHCIHLNVTGKAAS